MRFVTPHASLCPPSPLTSPFFTPYSVFFLSFLSFFFPVNCSFSSPHSLFPSCLSSFPFSGFRCVNCELTPSLLGLRRNFLPDLFKCGSRPDVQSDVRNLFQSCPVSPLPSLLHDPQPAFDYPSHFLIFACPSSPFKIISVSHHARTYF